MIVAAASSRCASWIRCARAPRTAQRERARRARAARGARAIRCCACCSLGTFLCALLETQMFSTFSIYMTDELHLSEGRRRPALHDQRPRRAAAAAPGARADPPARHRDDAAVGVARRRARLRADRRRRRAFAGGAIAMITLTGAEVIFDPAHQTAIAEVADPARRGRTFGVVGFAQMIGIAFAPLVGGILLDTIGDHHAAMWGADRVLRAGQTMCFVAFVAQTKRSTSRRSRGVESARDEGRRSPPFSCVAAAHPTRRCRRGTRRCPTASVMGTLARPSAGARHRPPPLAVLARRVRQHAARRRSASPNEPCLQRPARGAVHRPHRLRGAHRSRRHRWPTRSSRRCSACAAPISR